MSSDALAVMLNRMFLFAIGLLDGIGELLESRAVVWRAFCRAFDLWCDLLHKRGLDQTFVDMDGYGVKLTLAGAAWQCVVAWAVVYIDIRRVIGADVYSLADHPIVAATILGLGAYPAVVGDWTHDQVVGALDCCRASLFVLPFSAPVREFVYVLSLHALYLCMVDMPGVHPRDATRVMKSSVVASVTTYIVRCKIITEAEPRAVSDLPLRGAFAVFVPEKVYGCVLRDGRMSIAVDDENALAPSRLMACVVKSIHSVDPQTVREDLERHTEYDGDFHAAGERLPFFRIDGHHGHDGLIALASFMGKVPAYLLGVGIGRMFETTEKFTATATARDSRGRFTPLAQLVCALTLKRWISMIMTHKDVPIYSFMYAGERIARERSGVLLCFASAFVMWKGVLYETQGAIDAIYYWLWLVFEEEGPATAHPIGQFAAYLFSGCIPLRAQSLGDVDASMRRDFDDTASAPDPDDVYNHLVFGRSFSC